MSHEREKEFQEAHYMTDGMRVLRSPLMQRRQQRIREILVAACPHAETARVLSLGCGNGEYEIQSASRFGHITGMDLSETAIEQARERAAASGVANVSFHVGDCTDLAREPFAEPFDAVWALGFLHHISDGEIARLLRDARQLLKPRGAMVTVDPSARRAIGLLKGLVRRQIERHHSPDERELVPGWLLDRFREAGFAQCSMTYTDFFAGPLAWVFPRHAPVMARILWPVDRWLCSIPGARTFSSGFQIVARVP